MTNINAYTQQLFNDYAAQFEKLLKHLNDDLLPRLVDILNNQVSPVHFGKLSHTREPIPLNERNLTDTRTRIGVLLEYALAFQLQDVLKGGTYTAGFLVANQFPDITTRHVTNFTQGARLEIKAIQSISEEKAANFSTLIQDISPDQDILCVLVWEWKVIQIGTAEVHYPHILRGYAMHAHVIARLRDMAWLALEGEYNSPKLIDVAGALVPNSKKVNEQAMKSEERNLGKLTRMISASGLETINSDFEALKTDRSVETYFEMVKFAYNRGVEKIIERELEEAGLVASVTWNHEFELDQMVLMATINVNGRPLHIIGNDTHNKLTLASMSELMKSMLAGDVMIEMNPKFGWYLWKIKEVKKNPNAKKTQMILKKIEAFEEFKGDKPEDLRRAQGNKPKDLRTALRHYYSIASAISSASSV